MKAEFNSRVEFQRQVLKLVNKKSFDKELCGLSRPALDNWILDNRIVDSDLKEVMYRIAEKLFFIANKSQDQITEEYKRLQFSVSNDINNLQHILN